MAVFQGSASCTAATLVEALATILGEKWPIVGTADYEDLVSGLVEPEQTVLATLSAEVEVL